jgi:hypothetical protein
VPVDQLRLDGIGVAEDVGEGELARAEDPEVHARDALLPARHEEVVILLGEDVVGAVKTGMR